MDSRKIRSLYGLILCLVTLAGSMIPFAFALTVSTDKNSYKRGEIVTVTVSEGTGSKPIMIQFHRSSGQVWAYQDSFASDGTYQYQLKIPSSWALGTYTVTVKDLEANTIETTTFNIYTTPSPRPNKKPKADAGPNQKISLGSSIHLSSAGSFDSDGFILSYSWDFGDGNTATGPEVDHTYSGPGIYVVTLTVKDNRGGEDFDKCTVMVWKPPAPVADKFGEYVPGEQKGFKVNALEEANTTVTLDTTNNVTVTVIKYSDNPHPEDPMPETALPYYVDVEVSDPDAVDWPIYVEMFYSDEDVEGMDEGSLGIYYWMDGEWRRCSNTGVNTTRNVVWAYMTAEEASGSPILMGGTLPLEPAEFEVSGLRIEPEVVELGSAVMVSVDVTNVGEETGSYNVTLNVEEGLIISVREVTLNGGESERVEFEVLPEADGTYDLSIDALRGSFTVLPPITPPPLPPILSGLTITPAEVELGGEVTVSLDVENIDGQSFTYIVTMEIGELTLLVDVELGAYESTTASRTLTMYAVGEYGVAVDGLTGSFTVMAPPRPAEFEATGLEIAPEEVEEGEEVSISFEVSNVGEEEGTHTVELMIDGSLEDSEAVTLPGGGSEEVSFEVTRGEGSYQVEADGLTGVFTVVAPPGPPITPGYFSGILILVVVAAVVIVYLFMERRGPFRLPPVGTAQS